MKRYKFFLTFIFIAFGACSLGNSPKSETINFGEILKPYYETLLANQDCVDWMDVDIPLFDGEGQSISFRYNLCTIKPAGEIVGFSHKKSKFENRKKYVYAEIKRPTPDSIYKRNPSGGKYRLIEAPIFGVTKLEGRSFKQYLEIKTIDKVDWNICRIQTLGSSVWGVENPLYKPLPRPKTVRDYASVKEWSLNHKADRAKYDKKYETQHKINKACGFEENNLFIELNDILMTLIKPDEMAAIGVDPSSIVLSKADCCQGQASEVSRSELEDEIEIRGIRSGLIGELDLVEIPTTDYPEVKLIQVVNRKKKEVASQGVGTRVRDYVNKQDYILTAAHLFNYDREGFKHSDFILHVSKSLSKEGAFEQAEWHFISPKLYPSLDLENNDLILIPVKYDNSAPAYRFDSLGQKNDEFVISEISTVSVLNLKHSKKIRKAKQTANLLSQTDLFGGSWKTDADVFPGMSGSPVFNADKKIIGIISRATKLKSCESYDKNFCSNVVVPLKRRLIEDRSETIFADKHFLHAEENK